MEIYTFDIAAFLYSLVAIRVCFDVIGMYRRLCQLPEYHYMKKHLILRGIRGILLWPVDFLHVPKLFLRTFWLRNNNDLIKMGIYYSKGAKLDKSFYQD